MPMTETLQDILHNIDEQMRRERLKVATKSPTGDRRVKPGIPPQGMEERRSGQERRHSQRLPIREKEIE